MLSGLAVALAHDENAAVRGLHGDVAALVARHAPHDALRFAHFALACRLARGRRKRQRLTPRDAFDAAQLAFAGCQMRLLRLRCAPSGHAAQSRAGAAQAGRRLIAAIGGAERLIGRAAGLHIAAACDLLRRRRALAPAQRWPRAPAWLRLAWRRRRSPLAFSACRARPDRPASAHVHRLGAFAALAPAGARGPARCDQLAHSACPAAANS